MRSGSVRPSGERAYDERLWAPWYWWLIGVAAVVTVWLVFRLLGGVWPWAGAAMALVAVAAALLAYGAARVAVSADGLRAGRALLPLTAVGEARALSSGEAARLRGRDYDPQAYHLIRAYVPTAVRVEVADRADPTPYWYIATRHPDRLVAALTSNLRR